MSAGSIGNHRDSRLHYAQIVRRDRPYRRSLGSHPCDRILLSRWCRLHDEQCTCDYVSLKNSPSVMSSTSLLSPKHCANFQELPSSTGAAILWRSATLLRGERCAALVVECVWVLCLWDVKRRRFDGLAMGSQSQVHATRHVCYQQILLNGQRDSLRV